MECLNKVPKGRRPGVVPALKGQKNLAQGFSPGLGVAKRCALKVAPAPRTRAAIPNWRSTPTLQYSITPRGRIRGRGRERSASHAALDSLSSIPIILAKADIFQALVKAVGLFELGDGNRVGAVPTALKQFSIHGKNFIEVGR
jgi:hypothetical protein